MPMHALQAAWLESTVTELEHFLNNEKNNPHDRTISETDRKYLWRVRGKMIRWAAQMREDGKRLRE